MIYIPMPTVIVKENGEVETTAASKHLIYYYNEMSRDGTLQHAFYDGCAQTYENFKNVVFDERIIFMLIYDRSRLTVPIGHVHLTDFLGYSAMIHFNVLRPYHKNAIQIGQDVVKYLFNLNRFDGTPLLKCLVGVTPKTNRAALGLIKQLGFKRLGFLDGACRLFYRNRYVDGILTKAVNHG